MDKKETIFGYLRNYCIDKQFYESAFNKYADVNVFIKQLNKYKHKALFIEISDFVLNICRTEKAKKLPPYAKYKKELSERNMELLDLLPEQLTLFPYDDINIYCGNKKYAFITYGYNKGNLTHLNLVIPCSKYKDILGYKNFLKNIQIYKNYISNEKKEEYIVSLKDSLLQISKDKLL